jgi:hypothetical protein
VRYADRQMANAPDPLRELVHRLRNQLNTIAVTADLIVDDAGAGPLADDARVISKTAQQAGETAAAIARLLRSG